MEEKEISEKAPAIDLANNRDDVIAEELSPSDEILIDLSKELLKEAIPQSREFHKTMLSLTATFTTLLASIFSLLVLGTSNQVLKNSQTVYLSVPVFLLLLSSICFALGYYHPLTQIQLEDLTQLRQTRKKVLKRRARMAFLGIIFFTLAIVSLMGEMIFFSLK